MLKRLGMIMIVLAVFPLILGCSGGGNKAIDRRDMDVSVRPGEDFFQYANGTWLKKCKIPADRASYSSFDIVREQRDQDVHDLLEQVSRITDAEAGSITQKISDFYATGMDTRRIEEQGIDPLKPELDAIASIETIQDVQDLTAHFHTIGLGPIFGGGVEQDMMNTEQYRFYLMQGGLGLPDRDYYVEDEDRAREIRAEYLKHVARIFRLLNEDEKTADEYARIIMQMETQLAEKSKTRLEMRNIPALYNKMSLKKLERMTPHINWTQYFNRISEKSFGDVIVGMPEFFKEVSRMMDEVPVDHWKVYLRYHLVNSLAPFLNDDFVQANYEFYSAFLSGSEAIQKRWKRVVATTNGLLGEPVGQLYVEKHFPSESKERMLELVANLKKSLHRRITDLDWMGDETKEKALEKLATMRVKIGYPDKWEDYSQMEIKRDSYVMNVLRANQWHYHDNLDQFGKPVDPDKWSMTPQTVNAGYNPLKNDITFPAGILQPPFFYPEADDAVNYGAIGVVIGHEMTHGFDDQGRLFDKNGNMRSWWTQQDDQEFRKRVKPLIDQYDAFVAINDVHIDGKLTLGENIADFGGLTVSYQAYQMTLEGGAEPEAIDGFTNEQRFFLAYAKLWRGKIRDEALVRKCKEDVHPWGKFRVNGALFNVPEFYEAFPIEETDPLYRTEEQRPVIW